MPDEDDITHGALEILVDAQRGERDREREMAERAEAARTNADEARLALAQLAEPAVRLIAARLYGVEVDDGGRAVTKDREDTAWEVLSRIGVPRLRATAVAASIAAATRAPAPDSPGWDEGDDEEGREKELDPASVDAQIEAFLEGARAARDLGAGE
jgi:hypothetical protein